MSACATRDSGYRADRRRNQRRRRLRPNPGARASPGVAARRNSKDPKADQVRVQFAAGAAATSSPAFAQRPGAHTTDRESRTDARRNSARNSCLSRADGYTSSTCRTYPIQAAVRKVALRPARTCSPIIMFGASWWARNAGRLSIAPRPARRATRSPTSALLPAPWLMRTSAEEELAYIMGEFVQVAYKGSSRVTSPRRTWDMM